MNKKRTNPDFLNGVPELLILRLLSRQPMYGYEIVQAIRRSTEQTLEFGEGCVYPILQHFADDASFHGTVICDLVPGLLLVPSFAPPFQNSQRAIDRLHSQTLSQRWSFLLSLPLERTFACLKVRRISESLGSASPAS